jgi:hypothetical protein
LVELLVVVVIIPLVVGAIGVALVTTLTNTNTTSNTITESGDAQLVSSTFVSDVQSAASLTNYTTNNSPPGGPAICATPAQEAGQNFTPIFSSLWENGTTEVSYVEITETSGNSVLRNFCQGSPSTPVSTSAVSHNAQSGVTAVVAGIPCPYTLTPTNPACPSKTAGWTSAAGTAYVQMSIQEPISSSGGTYRYALYGSPRVTSTASSGLSGGGNLPLLLLGGSGTDYSCNGNLTVDGEMAMDSTTGGSSTSGTVTATGGFYTANTNNPDGALAGTGTYSPAPPPPPSYGPPIPNPYQTLTIGSALNGLPTNPATQTDSSGDTVYVPGIYTSGISISGGGNVVFNSGVYELEGGGFSLTGSANLTGDGVFFYITSGTFDIGGTGNVTLTPANSPPSPASNLVVWQTTPNEVELHGSGSTQSIAGTIYAPNPGPPAPGAYVDIKGGGSGTGLKIGALVTNAVTCSGSNPSYTITGQ